MEELFSLDKHLFKIINYHGSNPFFDWLMPLLRTSNLWLPLYLFFLLFGLMNFRKTGWLWVLFGIGTAILTDFTSSTLIKHNIIRVRPCNEPEIASWINVLVGYRPQSSSFTSSHAANHFGMAMYLYVTLKTRFKSWPWLFFLWAFLICYAQVYVGVHYPGDILGGALIGILIGYLSARSFNKTYGLV